MSDWRGCHVYIMSISVIRIFGGQRLGGRAGGVKAWSISLEFLALVTRQGQRSPHGPCASILGTPCARLSQAERLQYFSADNRFSGQTDPNTRLQLLLVDVCESFLAWEKEREQYAVGKAHSFSRLPCTLRCQFTIAKSQKKKPTLWESEYSFTQV